MIILVHLVFRCPTDIFVGFTNACNTKHADMCGVKHIRRANQANLCLKMTVLKAIVLVRSRRSSVDITYGQ